MATAEQILDDVRAIMGAIDLDQTKARAKFVAATDEGERDAWFNVFKSYQKLYQQTDKYRDARLLRQDKKAERLRESIFLQLTYKRNEFDLNQT